jgi:hypothetical protein
MDGVAIGQFDDSHFRDKIVRGEISGDHYYWHAGMADWKPISEYRAPGRVTTILENIPTREMKRAELSKANRDTPIKKLKRLLRLGKE